MRETSTLKKGIARGLAAVFILQMGTGTSFGAPIQIPTGNINFGNLAAQSAVLSTADLVKWRTGTANTIQETGVTAMSFAYLASPGAAPISRTSPADNTANNQGDMWSDNAIKISYTRPNNAASAVVIYTNNTDGGLTDPLSGATLRGGLVGGAGGTATDPNRSSVLPLLWKAVPKASLQSAALAKVDGTVKIANNNPVYMPTQITNATGGTAPAEGPYSACNRTNNGYCDFSTHFFLDKNNTDPANLWYTNPLVVDKPGAFNYASVVGKCGVNTSEVCNQPGSTDQPAYLLLGVNAASALQTQYATTINLEAVSF